MGVVFRARDSQLGRDVALKCPMAAGPLDPVARERFVRGSRAAARVSHPSIVPVYEVLEARELPWVAMELVEGRTLADVLATGEPLPMEATLRHAEDLADALRAAHAKGILHRDLKPANVLLDGDHRARLTDFGLARIMASGETASLGTTASGPVTLEGRIVGTPAYMPPEQLEGAPPDVRGDIFSLGVVLYEMCTGRPAFGPSHPESSYPTTARREPIAIARLNYEVPRSFERIVRKAIARRPDERYQTAADMLSDIRALRRRIASGESDLDEDLSPPRRRRWAGASALTLFALGGLAAGVWGLQHGVRTRVGVLGTPHQITTAPGAETDPAVSPDGSLIAYTSDESGNQDIWLVDARGGHPMRLTDDPADDGAPAWSPDGAFLAFASQRGDRPGVWKVPVLGGSATLLVPDAADPAISPDGRRIAFVREPSDGPARIYVAPIDAPQKAVSLTREAVGLWGQFAPAWSPDSRSIAFRDYQHLWIADVPSGAARQLTDGVVSDYRPAWTPDGRDLVFGAYRNGTTALWRVPASGGPATRLTYGSGSERLPSFDRKGTRLAFSTFVDERDLALRDTATGAVSVIRSQGNDFGPAIAPDGSRVVFSSERWGKIFALASIAMDGARATGEVTRLTDWPAALPRYSPDGAWLAFWRNDGGRDIWVMPSAGGDAIRFDDDPAADVQPAWSPDGHRLAFSSERGGRTRVWTAPIARGRREGPALPITSGDGKDMFPEWSPDGRAVAFVRTSGAESEVWLVDADGKRERELTYGAGAQLVRWLAPPTGMVVSGTWQARDIELRTVDPVSGRSKPLAPPWRTDGDQATALFDFDRRGRVMATSIQERRGDIWVVDLLPGSF